MYLLVEYKEAKDRLKVVSEEDQFAYDLEELIIKNVSPKELFGRDTTMYIEVDEVKKHIHIDVANFVFIHECDYDEMSPECLFDVISGISDDLKAAPSYPEEQGDASSEDEMSVDSFIEELLAKCDDTMYTNSRPDEDGQKTERQDDTEQDNTDMYKDRVYAKPLRDYLNNIRKMIETAGKMETPVTIWSQALLLSIDDGCGITTFLKNLSDIYVETGVLESKLSGNAYSEWHGEYMEKEKKPL